MKKAILFGATGFIGSHLVENLLSDPSYERVTIVVRKDPGVNHPKLKTLFGDFKSLPGLKSEIVADDVFITLGTTKKQTPDRNEYYQIDHDYPVLAARLAKENGAKSVLMVTAVGANAKSGIFYVRTKGEVERDVIALGFEHTLIFQPSMIIGQRKEHRTAEKFFVNLWAAIDPVLAGPLNSYKGIDGKDIAKAMQCAAKNPSEKLKFYQWKEMSALNRVEAR